MADEPDFSDDEIALLDRLIDEEAARPKMRPRYSLVRPKGTSAPLVYDATTMSWRFWRSGDHPRGNPEHPENPGKFAPKGAGGGSAHPRAGKSGESPGQAKPSGALRSKLGAFIDKIPGGRLARSLAQKLHARAVERYGAKTAAAIVASGQAVAWGSFGVGAALGVPGWIPNPFAMIPGVVLAELHHQLAGQKHEGKHVELGKEQIDKQGKEMADALKVPEGQATPEMQAAAKELLAAHQGEKKITETPQFRAWFGQSKVVDADGEPAETASIAGLKTNEKGKPLVVYHGSPRGEFHEFKKDKIAEPEQLHYGPGFYFTEDVAAAQEFAKGGHSAQATGDKPTVMSYYLRADKPFDAERDTIDPSKLPEADVARQTLVQRAFQEQGKDDALELRRAFDAGEVRLKYKELTSSAGVGGLGLSKAAIQRHLQSLGHDSIKTGERFWVVFEPEQIKETTAQKFDPADPRTNMSLGQFREEDHPRGQPENKGEFAEKGQQQAPVAGEQKPQDLAALTQSWANARRNLGIPYEHRDNPQNHTAKIALIAKTLQTTLEKLTPALRQKALANLDGIPYLYGSIADVSHAANDGLKGPTTYGFFALTREDGKRTGKGELHVDYGDERTQNAFGGSLEESVLYLYAHELAHAADGDDEYSGKVGWRDAWKQEIKRTRHGGLAQTPSDWVLSENAASSNFEGFADFIAVATLHPEKAKGTFPACWAWCERKGLVGDR